MNTKENDVDLNAKGDGKDFLARKTSVLFGTGDKGLRNSMTLKSQNTKIFDTKVSQNDSETQKQVHALADRIKRNNFEYGSTYQDVRNRYMTTQHNTHDY